uniref:Uncharacterized protein n=1 Tax=Anguilla anguilla TaxID=7936 RepID=A0A0E9U083_ANGAN
MFIALSKTHAKKHHQMFVQKYIYDQLISSLRERCLTL